MAFTKTGLGKSLGIVEQPVKQADKPTEQAEAKKAEAQQQQKPVK